MTYVENFFDYGYNFHNTPNNKYLSNIDIVNNKASFLHITSHYEQIIQYKGINPTVGCMCAGLYCTPLTHTNNTELYKIHNLGLRYLEEAKIFAIQQYNNIQNIKCIFIEVDNIGLSTIKGFNYIKNGTNYYKYFNKIKNSHSIELINNINNEIIFKNNNAKNFLKLCINNYEKNINTVHKDNICDFINLINDVPIFGYIYFEAFSISIMLNQTNNYCNEFNNNNYRNILFNLYPEFYQQFNLRNFKINFNILLDKIKQLDIFLAINKFENDFFLILNTLLYDVLFFNIENITKDYSTDSLFGHQFRLIKINQKEFFNLKNNFNDIMAKSLWKQLQNHNINILKNSIFNKGEMAIYPVKNNIKFYDSDIVFNNQIAYLKKNNILKLNFNKQLVDNNLITMSGHKNV